MEQAIDQLSIEYVPSREELLVENQRLREEVDSERKNAEELSMQLQILEKGMFVDSLRAMSG